MLGVELPFLKKKKTEKVIIFSYADMCAMDWLQFSFFFSIFDSEGITGLSLETFKENWSSDYQKTNDAGIPETDGSVSWNFK